MAVPNGGPELPDSHQDARKGNPAHVYGDELPTDDVVAASSRAVMVSHRFGGARYALSRPEPPAECGESDPGE